MRSCGPWQIIVELFLKEEKNLESLEWEERISIGIVCQKELPTFEEQLPALSKGPLMKQKVEPGQVERLLNEFL
jgi:hypothetical protein